MRTGRRFRGWVVAAVVGGGAPGLAQSPAARLVPIDPNKASAVPVARSAYPDIPDAQIYPVPAQGYAGQPRPAAPPPDRPRTWVGGAWSGVKELVAGKPTAAEMPPAVPPGTRLPQPRQVPPAPAPAPQRPPEPAAQPPTAPPQPAVYAGPPAYRWYGWGSTTPGANQYAPHGLYPKGSANWYSHTGATPGAFPVPIQYPTSSPGVEPPVYAGNPTGYDAAYLASSRTARPEPDPSPEPRRPARAAVAPPAVEPPPGLPPAPSVPSGPPMPLPSNSLASGPDDRHQELNWQTVTPVPAASPPAHPPQPYRPPVPVSSPSDLQWTPAATHNYPGTVVPASLSVTPLVRGQQPSDTPPDVPALIRAACFSRVNQVYVVESGKGKLAVTFVTTTEQLAREAAAVVSKLPELRPYEVRFDVQLTK